MMDTCSDPGENQFFDALEEIAVCSDSGSECLDDGESVSSSTQFDVWIHDPESVQSRRSKFLDWLGVDECKIYDDDDDTDESSDFERENDEIENDSGTLMSSTSFENEFSSSRSSVSCFSCDDLSSSVNLNAKVNFVPEIKNKGREMDGNVSDQSRELVRDTSAGADQRQSSSSSSSFSGEFSPVKGTTRSWSLKPTKRVKKWWFCRMRSFTSVTEKDEESCKYDSFAGSRFQRVKVHHTRKQSKELSALFYNGQSIQAHKGAILTMKFSTDGKYLASAGEDRIVRVWQVIEDDRLHDGDFPDMEPSSVYFTMNHRLELRPLSIGKEKNGRLKRNSDSACVVLPPKVFRILERPLHEFHGHTSEILDLSWSKSNHLLSSSVDKTARLWRVGHNHCLKVFPHNNYVTCVEFNPVDENYFISGSIDGKVRVWDISKGKVAYWTEIKDIVTAVCYRLDGKGGIIGSITGSCRFYRISDNQMQLDTQIFLDNKKKSSGKRITGFQFFPQDPSKVMISCADSQVRIVQGVDVIGKYKGIKSAGTFGSAHFTSDGRHIVSAFEDSNVYIWNCSDQSYRESSHIKKVKSSERFISSASVALPWPGLQNERSGNRWRIGALNGFGHGTMPSFSPAHFSCRPEFFQDSYFQKGSALWPEEKLLARSKTSMHKSEYKFLRTCQSRSDSHAWGMVIVTAGWDGRIRSFHNYGLPVPN